MNRFVAIAGVTVLAVCLIGWAALAWAQSGTEKGAAGSDPSAKVSGAKPVEEIAPAAPLVDVPGKTESGVGQRFPILGAATPPAAPGTSSPPPSKDSPSIAPLGPPPQTGSADKTPAPSAAPGPGVLPVPGKPEVMDPELLGEEPARKPAETTTPPSQSPQPLTPPQPDAALPPADNNAAKEEERHAETTLSPESISSRQEPAVSLEWFGPPTAKIGQANTYNLAVRNTCSIPVEQVLVRVRIPAGITCPETAPKAAAKDSDLVWELGALQPRQEKVLQMKLVPEQRGDPTPQAWVTFTGSSLMRIKVREPKVAVKARGPKKVLIGETATFILAVSNPGDGVAEQVKIHAALTEGLENARGSKLEYDIGNLAGGETRNVAVQCVGKLGGAQKCDVTVEADGDLHAEDSADVNVSVARLELRMAGPALRYLGRKALYTITVSNPGDAPARNVTVSDQVPEGFKVLAATDGGRYDFSTRTVSWFLGEIGPGQSHEVKLEAQAVTPGELKHKANVVAARGLNAESEWTTRVEGLSALMLEMVDTEDPIEVGSETAYEVRITNTGSKVETNIHLAAVIPDKMEFKNAVGPVRFHAEGKTIVFEPLEKLAPRADAIFRIRVKALDPGIVRFKVQMTSTNLTEPVIKMEATRIYADAPEAKSSPR